MTNVLMKVVVTVAVNPDDIPEDVETFEVTWGTSIEMYRDAIEVAARKNGIVFQAPVSITVE